MVRTLAILLASTTVAVAEPAYVGAWAPDTAICENLGTDSDEVPSVFSERSIQNYEGRCEFDTISGDGPTWTVQSKCSEQGETTQYDFEMTVDADTMEIDEHTAERRLYVLKRCPAIPK